MKKYNKVWRLIQFFLLISLPSYASYNYNGIYYNATSSNTVEVISGTSYSGDIIIPNTISYNGVQYTVTSIGQGAFSNCRGLTSVTIPNSVTSIGSSAFNLCTGLTSMTIPNSVTTIGRDAFYECPSLTSVHITDVAAWCEIAFDNYYSNPLYYAQLLYLNRKEIKDLVIPNSVTSIRGPAFYGCSRLTSVTIPNSVTSIGNSAFGGCSGLTSVTIGNSVTSIGNSAFSGCSGLTSMTIPNSVTSIGNSAFSGCSGLTSVTIGSSVTSIGNSAFSGCRALTSVTIPNSVTNIGISAFENCRGFTSMTIPNSVTSIGDRAFWGCSNLSIVKSEITSPFSIQNTVFNGISSNARLQVPKGTKSAYQALSGWSTYFSEIVEANTVENFVVDGIYYKVLSGNTVEVIQNPSGGSYSGNIAIPSSVVYEGVQYIVTSIGNSAFANSNGLTSMSIPSSVTNIGSYAFLKCYNLASVNIPSGVTTIGEGVFYSCSSLPRVTIPNGVTTIDISAFRDCSSLTSVTIPSSVMVIQGNPFQGCTSLASIVVESGNSEYDSRNNCNAIIETSTNTLFVGCKNTVIPSSVKKVSGFTGCSSLTSITIPYGVETIGSSAFAGCVNLASISISNSVKTIDSYAFQGCTALTSVTIPSGVKTIGYYAFQNCSSLSLVKSEITSPFSIQNMVFKGISSNAILQVPEGTKSAYQALSGWSAYFKEIVEANSSYILSITASGNGIVTYNDDSFSNKSNSYSVQKGSTVTLTFTPNTGYRLASVKVNNTDVTSQVSINKYTISNISQNTTVEVMFIVTRFPEPKYVDMGLSVRWAEWDMGAQTTDDFGDYFGWGDTSGDMTSTNPDDYAQGFTGTSIAGTNYDVAHVKWGKKWRMPTEAEIIELAENSTWERIERTSPTTGATVSGYLVTSKITNNSIFLPAGGSYKGTTGERVNSYVLLWTAEIDIASTLPVYYHWALNNPVRRTNTKEMRTLIRPVYELTTSSPLCTFSIKAVGSGSVEYNGRTIHEQTRNYPVEFGASATLKIKPDYGYRIASVKVNGKTVASKISSSSYDYVVENITNSTTVEVGFEKIPTYLLSVSAFGEGFVSCGQINVGNGTHDYNVYEGNSATLVFTPNSGYRLASLKVNNTDVTSQVSNNKYTISKISQNTSVVVTFEAIPTYSLSITASTGGTVSYNSVNVTNGSRTFSVYEGSSATLTITPNSGFRLVSVKVNDTDVTSQVLNKQYTISNITQNAGVIVTFEEIPPLTYSLNISASVGGTVSYNSENVTEGTKTYYVNEGSSTTLTFTPNSGYRLVSVKVNNTDVTSLVSNNKYTISNISQNTTVEVTFSSITHTLTVSASGYGVVTYQGNEMRNLNRSYSVNEGVSATISFAPDDGYRIASVKVNDVDVTSEVVDNQYVVSNIKEDIWIVVTFGEKPLQIYSLTITASGDGSVSFNGESVNSETSTYSVTEGSSATLVLTPGSGYRIASVKVNDVDVTSQVANNKYTISKISDNTTVVVTFEAIPPQTYTLNISVLGGGSVSYNDKNVTNGTQTFTVNEGSAVTMTFVPSDGYRIASVKVNDVDVTSQVSNNQYTINNITANTTVVVTFEEIPIVTYSLSIAATGNGDVSYDGVTVKEQTSLFIVNEGTSATITITPGDGYRIASVKVNGVDVTAQVANNQYNISNITTNMTVEVVFVVDIKALTNDGVNYVVVSYEDKTVKVSSGDYGLCLTVPTEFASNDFTWSVVGIEDGALISGKDLAAVVWNPSVPFTASVENPNLLLYVTNKQYAPLGIQNVIVNGVADEVILTDAESGNNFYCPQEFTASSINYAHRFEMMTGFGESRGWETIALPFDVQQVSDSKGRLLPFATWQTGGDGRPFWLYELDNSGWVMTGSIKANTPYIISMPNNERYAEEYCIIGNVVFSASNAKVMTTDDLKSASNGEKTFIPNFVNKEKAASLYALNVDNEFENATGGYTEGSVFVKNLRRIHPFEAYMTVSGTNAKSVIAVFEDGTSGIRNIELLNIEGKKRVYNLSGQQIRLDENGRISHLRKGVYIIDGKKKVVK